MYSGCLRSIHIRLYLFWTMHYLLSILPRNAFDYCETRALLTVESLAVAPTFLVSRTKRYTINGEYINHEGLCLCRRQTRRSLNSVGYMNYRFYHLLLIKLFIPVERKGSTCSSDRVRILKSFDDTMDYYPRFSIGSRFQLIRMHRLHILHLKMDSLV